MKNFIFGIFVVLMTPVYLIINFLKFIIEGLIYLPEPFIERMSRIIETMAEFWKKVFKMKEAQ